MSRVEAQPEMVTPAVYWLARCWVWLLDCLAYFASYSCPVYVVRREQRWCWERVWLLRASWLFMQALLNTEKETLMRVLDVCELNHVCEGDVGQVTAGGVEGLLARVQIKL